MKEKITAWLSLLKKATRRSPVEVILAFFFQYSRVYELRSRFSGYPALALLVSGIISLQLHIKPAHLSETPESILLSLCFPSHPFYLDKSRNTLRYLLGNTGYGIIDLPYQRLEKRQ